MSSLLLPQKKWSRKFGPAPVSSVVINELARGAEKSFRDGSFSLQLEAAHSVHRRCVRRPVRVVAHDQEVVLCAGNSARSQMAEAFLLKHQADRYEAGSSSGSSG